MLSHCFLPSTVADEKSIANLYWISYKWKVFFLLQPQDFHLVFAFQPFFSNCHISLCGFLCGICGAFSMCSVFNKLGMISTIISSHMFSFSFFSDISLTCIFFFLFYFIFKLYNIVLFLPNIEMNPPQVYICSPSWTLLPPPSPFHPSGSSQCTSPKHPVSCIEPELATRFIHDILHVSMPFSQIFPPSPSLSESIRLFYTSVSLLLSCTQGYCYHLSKFHIYALVYCIGVFLSGLPHSV